MCILALPQLHYSLAELLACELAPIFRPDNLLEEQVVAAAQSCFASNFQPALEVGLSTNKEPCGVTCFLVLPKAAFRASPSLICSRVLIVLQYCPPVVWCLLWCGLSVAQMPCCSMNYQSHITSGLHVVMHDMNGSSLVTFCCVNISISSSFLPSSFQSRNDFKLGW